MTTVPCPRGFGRARCGVPMEPVVDRLGRVTLVCPACERNRQGLCRDCPAPVTHFNQARCKRCAAKRNRTKVRENGARWYAEHRAEKLARQRERYHQDPAVRARVAERGRAIRGVSRHDDLWRFVHRTRMAQWRQTPKGRASSRQSQAKYAAKRRAARRAQERAA